MAGSSTTPASTSRAPPASTPAEMVNPTTLASAALAAASLVSGGLAQAASNSPPSTNAIFEHHTMGTDTTPDAGRTADLAEGAVRDVVGLRDRFRLRDTGAPTSGRTLMPAVLEVVPVGRSTAMRNDSTTEPRGDSHLRPSVAPLDSHDGHNHVSDGFQLARRLEAVHAAAIDIRRREPEAKANVG